MIFRRLTPQLSRSPLRVPVAAYGGPTSFTGNAHNFPTFHPKDNTQAAVDLKRHDQTAWEAKDLKTALRDHSVFTWGASDPLFNTILHVARTEGIYLYTHDDEKIMDWSAGAVCSNLGHTVPESIKKAISDQLEDNAFVYGDLASSDIRARLCALLADISPGDLDGFIFATGGSEANEAAIRMARRYTGRHKIMSRQRSYHGGSTASLAMTGDPRTWAVESPGFIKIADPFPFNFSWSEDPEEAAQKCLGALHDQIWQEGPSSIAAIFLEPVTGANGWLKTTTSWMQGVRALCDEYGILLVSDEVMTGFGRTGEMFGFQHFEGVLPDMYTFAKGTTAAYAPLSGVGMRKHVQDFFRTNPVGYGSTYFAHPLCCAAAYSTLKHTIDQDILGQVRSVSPVMTEEMDKLVAAHPSVKQGRAVGLGAGFDLAGKDGNFMMRMDQASEGVALLKRRFREEGLVTLIRGHHVHCTPPLIITADEIREGFAKMDRALTTVDEWIASQ